MDLLATRFKASPIFDVSQLTLESVVFLKQRKLGIIKNIQKKLQLFIRPDLELSLQLFNNWRYIYEIWCCSFSV